LIKRGQLSELSGLGLKKSEASAGAIGNSPDIIPVSKRTTTVLHAAREFVTHWFGAGAILAATGTAPEQWIAEFMQEVHFSTRGHGVLAWFTVWWL
jgi:hypothetical protein